MDGFKIKNLKAVDFQKAKVIDVSEDRSYGRRFKVKLGDNSLSKENVLKDIYKRVSELSDAENDPYEQNEDLKFLQTFLGEIKKADADGKIAYNNRNGWYKTRTWFHRILNFGKHVDKIDDLYVKIQKKIDKSQRGLEAIEVINNAVRTGDVEEFKQLVQTNKNLNLKGINGETALGTAIQMGKIDFVKILIDAGADINMPNKDSVSPLQIAVKAKNLEIVDLLLLSENIQINHVDNVGNTALTNAINTANKEILVSLLDCDKIDINQRNSKGETALLYAISLGQSEADDDIQALMDRLDRLINFENVDDVAKMKNNEIVELLLQHKDIDINMQDKNGKNSLISAVGSRSLENIKSLLKRPEIQINLQDMEGRTALIAAASASIFDNCDVVNLLLQNEAIEVNIQDNQGNTALIHASKNGHKEIAEALLKRPEIQINLQNMEGNTALLNAVMHGKLETVELILKSPDIQFNLQNNSGDTAYILSKFIKKDGLKNLLANSMKPTDLFMQKEMLKISLLAHSTNIGGTRQIQGESSEFSNNSYPLEGLPIHYLLNKLNNALQVYKEAIEENEFIQFVDLLETSVDPSNVNILERIEKGLPVMIPTGYRGHSVEVMVWGPYFILCNRGGARRKVVEVFSFDSKKINNEVLNTIRNSRNQDANGYRQLFFNELPVDLDFKPQGPLEKALEKMCTASLVDQTVGNCTWTSAEAAIFSFFAFSTILPGSDGQLNLESIPLTISDQQMEEINNKFFKWVSFTQTYQLERYLGQHVIRPSNNDKIEQRAERRKVVKIDYFVVLTSLKAIESTAKKAPNSDETLNIVKTLLAKTLALKIAGDEEQHLKTAQEILDSLWALNPDKLKAKFEQ